MDLSQSGWNVRHGQAVWRSKKAAPEIAGELLVAMNRDGRSFVQFTKTPLPFIEAQSTTNAWQLHSIPDNKTYTGRGKPPVRASWLWLPRCLSGTTPPKPLRLAKFGKQRLAARKHRHRRISGRLPDSMTRKFRYSVIAYTAACSSSPGMFRLRFDTDVLNLLPDDLPVVQGLQLYQRHFTDSRELIITVRAPDAAQTEAAAALSGAKNCARRPISSPRSSGSRRGWNGPGWRRNCSAISGSTSRPPKSPR